MVSSGRRGSRDEYRGDLEAWWLVFVRSGTVFAAREVEGVQDHEPVVDFGGRGGWARGLEVAVDVGCERFGSVEGVLVAADSGGDIQGAVGCRLVDLSALVHWWDGPLAGGVAARGLGASGSSVWRTWTSFRWSSRRRWRGPLG